MKVIVNRCWGGFGLSQKVMEELGIKDREYGYVGNKDFDIKDSNCDAYRADPRLIAAVEKIGLKESSDDLGSLQIVDITEGIDWYIHDYDGMETVHERHDSW